MILQGCSDLDIHSCLAMEITGTPANRTNHLENVYTNAGPCSGRRLLIQPYNKMYILVLFSVPQFTYMQSDNNNSTYYIGLL